jgi:hypothetical protein
LDKPNGDGPDSKTATVWDYTDGGGDSR